MSAHGIDPAKVAELKAREDARFTETHPRCIETWHRAERVMPNGVPMSWLRTSYDHPPLWVDDAKGARFRDVDGNEYADFNIADMSMFGGYGPEPVVEAVSRRIAAGSQFLLPNEDSIWVAEELGRRYGLPQWQFTLSATHANLEAIRIARVMTGREKVLFFGGKYHGHFDEGLVDIEDGRLVPEEAGLPRDVTDKVVIVPFNDIEALRAALETGDIAIVTTEPVLTNAIGLLVPEPGFHEALRAATRETGTLLCYDETHTQVVGPGGLTAMWGLEPDLVSIGKSIAGGVPLGAYGMTDEVAETLRRPAGRDDEKRVVATGGTLFGNPLSMAAAKATMGEVLTTRGVRAHAGARHAARRRHRGGRLGCRPALDDPPLLAALGLHVRPVDAARRRRGPRGARRAAAATDPRVPREPRRLGGDHRGRANVRRARHGGRRRRLRRRVRIAHRGAHVVTPPPRIEIIRVSGPNHLEAGRQLGEAARDRIHAEAAQAFDDLPAGRTVDQQRGLAKEYLAFTEPRLPWLVEELEGIAEAAAIDPLDFFAASIEELWYEPRRMVTQGRCSDVVAGPSATADGHLLVGHTNDLRPAAQEHIVGIEKQVAGDPTIFQLGGVPWLSVGWNSAGLSLTGNELSPNDERLGISRSHQVLEMMRARTLDEMVSMSLRDDRASSYNNVLTSADGGVANVEGSATDAEVTGLDDAGHLVHTNHYVCDRMLPFEGDPAYAEHSAIRYERARELIAARPPGSVTTGTMREILSDHETKPDSLCRHPEFGRPNSKTVFWCVADVTDGRITFGRGNPCDSEPQEYVFAEYPGR